MYKYLLLHFSRGYAMKVSGGLNPNRLMTWLACVLLLLAAALAVPARAADMVFFSTDETTQHANIAWEAFSAEASAQGLTPVDGRGALSSATAPLSVTPETKLIVVVTAFQPVNSTRMTELIDILKTRSDLAIVAFLDGCCMVDQNLKRFIAAINDIRPQSWPTAIGVGSYKSGGQTGPLNTHSLYQTTFANAGLTSIYLLDYSLVTGVPLDYALYTNAALSTPAPATVDDAVGFFMPHTASNSGQGACVYVMADASGFNVLPAQNPIVAKAFLAAATDPNGACKQPVAGAPDLTVMLSEPNGMASGAAVPVPMTLTVSNLNLPGVVASTTGGKVDVTLPAGLTLAAPPAGCTATASGFTCPLAAMAPGEEVEFKFNVTAPNPLLNVTATAVVSGVPNEVNLLNNTFTLNGIYTTNGTPDLGIALSGPDVFPVRTPTKMTMTMHNRDEPGVTASVAGETATVTVPSDLKIVVDAAHPLPPGCTVNATATSMTCPVGALNRGADESFDFYVETTEPILTETKLEAAVTGNVKNQDRNLSNNVTYKEVTSTGSPNLSASLSGNRNPRLNVPSDMKLTVRNSDEPGVSTAPSGKVDVTLPDGVELVPGSLPPACTPTATGFTCDVSRLPPGQSEEFDFQVITRRPVRNGEIKVDLEWDNGSGGTGQSPPVVLDISTVAADSTQSVPALSELALALLVLILAGGAAVGLRRGV
jgi:hypothetical protein